MPTQEGNRLLRAIAEAAKSSPEIQAAFLFGSHATGRARADSDIDVALLLDQAHPRIANGVRLHRAIEALTPYIAADRLDIVILNEAPPALAFQVLKHGKLAFERDATVLHRFRVRTYSQHADFEATERFFREVTRRRLLAGAGHG